MRINKIMKNITTILLLLISNVIFGQFVQTEYKLDQYKQKGTQVKFTKILVGEPVTIGNVYAFESSEYWGKDFGQLVNIDNNRYLLETYPQKGSKKIVKLRFNNLYNVDTNQKNLNQTVNLKMNDYLEKAGSNVQVGSLFLGALVANMIFYPQIFKIQSNDDFILYNVLNGGLALGTVISFSSAGMNLKLASKTK
jgi:hypothetical protein